MFVKVLLFVLFFCQVKSSTHWVVTEDGRIQEKLESSFAMKQPDDLVTFIQQERTYKYLKQTKEKLMKEQSEIEKNEDKDLKLEDVHYQQDSDCIAAGKKLPDFDLFITSVLPLENKQIEVEDFIHLIPVSSEVHEPNCSSSSILPYSVHAYDHLEGVQNRRFFPYHPVKGLKSTLKFLTNPDEAAEAIWKALQKNSTSWVLYDLAAFYWRMKGNLTEAVECLRRSLHFSPEQYKDVALVMLANILHRSQYTLNATVVMHHALKVSDEYGVNYFALGNMYAFLGLFNSSIQFYEETLKRQEDFTAARKALAAVKCQMKLQEKLEKQHVSLRRTLKELQRYKVKHEIFLKEQEHFASLHLPAKDLIENDIEMNRHIARTQISSIDPNFHVWANSSGVYFTTSPDNSNPYWFDENLFYDKPKPLKMSPNSEQQKTSSAEKTNRRRVKTVKKQPENIAVEEEERTEKPAASESNNNKDEKSLTNNTKPDTSEDSDSDSDHSDSDSDDSATESVYDWIDPSWPPPGSCDQYIGKLVAWDEFPSAYADPESRGYKVRSLITSELGLNGDAMHPKPWEFPNCVNLESIDTTPYDHFINLEQLPTQFKPDDYLQNCLLMHVNKGYVWPEDLGQRILTALRSAASQKNYNRLWVLYNLAGLFWRVNGDNAMAIECLRRSIYHSPTIHTDLPLVGLANIMYRLGKMNEAIHLLIFALKINNTEAASYLSMGNVLQAQNNITGAVQFYSYATILNPNYQEAIRALLIVKCLNSTKEKRENPQDVIAKWNSEVAADQKKNSRKLTEEALNQNGDAISKERKAETNEETKEKLENLQEKNKKFEKVTEKHENKEEEINPEKTVKNINEEAEKNKGQTTETPEVSKQKQEDVQNEYEKCSAADETTLMMNELAEGRADIDGLLQKTDNLIREIKHSDIDMLNDKLVAAQELMNKLAQMRNSLGEMVNEAKANLDVKEVNEIPCETLVPRVNFTFVSNTSYLNTVNDVVDDYSLSDGQDPMCDLGPSNPLQDIVDLSNIKQGPEEKRFSKILKTLLRSKDISNSLRSGLISLPRSKKILLVTSFFWRISGNSKQVLTCLLTSLVHTSERSRDLILYLISDYLAVLALYDQALKVASKLKSAPHNSYLLAKIHAAKGDYVKAEFFFNQTLELDPNFADSAMRFRAASCLARE